MMGYSASVIRLARALTSATLAWPSSGFARILHRYPASRRVLFPPTQSVGWPMLDIDEFPALEQVAAQIEWRAILV